MQLENSFVVPVPLDTAWQVLLDVERVAPCMPGATLDSVAGDEFTGRVKVKVGPITITYRGTARFVEKDEAAHVAVLEASGKETRGAGTAKATVRTELVGQGAETEVRVRTDLAVTGKPAQFGRGVLAEVSGKLIGQFAACLADEVRGQADGQADGSAAAADGSAGGGTAGSVPGAAPPAPDAVEPEPGPATPAPPAGAAPPLPPAGAPQAPAPAPAAPIGSVPPAAAPAAPPAATPVSPARPTAARQSAEAIDLVGAAGLPLAKRLLPVLVAAALVTWVVLRAARRR